MLKLKSFAQDSASAILFVTIALLLMLGLDPWLEMTQTPFLLFFGAVPFVALYRGRQAGIIATLLSALIANYFFIPPINSLTMDLVGFGRAFIFVFEGAVISILIGALRRAQKQTKNSLRQLEASEAKLRRLADSNIIGLVSADIYGAITEANDAFLNSLGFTREDLANGRVRWDEMTPADLKPLDVTPYEELVTKGRNTPYEKAFIGKQGQRVPVVVGAALLENNPEQIISFILDVSERKRTEQRLAVQYAVARALADAATLTEAIPQVLQSLCESLGWQISFFWKFNPHTNQLHYLDSWHLPNLNVASLVKANQETAFTQGAGLPGRIWASGKASWIDSITKDPNFPRKEIALEHGLHSVFGFPVSVENEILGVIECFSTSYQEPDDDLLHLMRAIGSQIGQFMERKQTEEELQASQALFQSFMNYSPANAYIKDESGRYLYVNRRIETTFNRSLLDWLDKTDFDFFPDEAAEAIRASDRVVLQTGQPTQITETIPFADGDHYYLSFKFPLQDVAGQRLLAGMSVDITDRRQAEAEREQLLAREKAARADAEAANRIKDEFLAVLSHELRTPLNPILGWSRLLRTGKLNQQKTEYALETIERNTKLQIQLIDDLLDISRILRGKLSLNVAPMDLALIIEAAKETISLAAEAKSIQIRVELEPVSKMIMGDFNRLQQVVWNLLSNAVKFTPSGGQIKVYLKYDEDYARMTVKDTGKGINPEFLPYVFEYFRQADSSTTRQFGGLGLGLAIARQIVDLHGGSIKVESAGEEQGATFIVTLPLQKSTSKQNWKSGDRQLGLDAANPQPLANLCILVVDDEVDNLDLTQFVLEGAGATVISSTSAVKALQLLTQVKPNILITDIGMPDMDGYTLLRHIKELFEGEHASAMGQVMPKAIALTAYAGDFNEQQALKAGFQRHVAKPIDPQELIKMITTLMHSS